MNVPNLDLLLKISLGLIMTAIVSSTLVYAETASVILDGTSYDVEYTGDGVSVTSIEADLDFMSLIITVNVTSSPGTLDVTFDRNFFDSTFQGIDDDFIILADGDEPPFVETETTDNRRTLSIELPKGTEEIEVIGSTFGVVLKEEPPVVEGPPVEEEPPVVERPPVEEEPPVVETPKPVEKPTLPPPVTSPKETKPKIECGPGTILKDGTCVLDQRCGPGTILKDGMCVLTPSPQSPSTPKGLGTELGIALIAAFIVAGAVGLILALISKASKSKN